MTENRSLDDFFDAESDADAGEEADADVDEGENEGDADSDTPASTVAEPRTTVRWTPGGVDCRACGARVEREWRDGDRFVCADCKEW